MSNATILVIDDHKELAELVQRSLSQQGFDVILAHDGPTGLRIAREHQPDLVVLDLTMPGMDGLEVCRELRQDPRGRKVPVIVLSARAGEEDRVIGLEQGADDYLIKPFSPRELLARVKAALRRSAMTQEGNAVIQSGDLTIDLQGHEATYGGKRLALLPSEFRILELLASRPGRTFTRDEIIDAALRQEEAVTERTVDVHITRLRKKLGAAADRIETVRTVGYKFRDGGKSDHPSSSG
jgi:DNA-binding response OmpR family regulator